MTSWVAGLWPATQLPNRYYSGFFIPGKPEVVIEIYYYVRVRQVNDAMAWSSPVWVGGFPSQ